MMNPTIKVLYIKDNTLSCVRVIPFGIAKVFENLQAQSEKSYEDMMHNLSSGGHIESGLSDVYTTASFVPTVGTNTFNFSTPFAWNGTSNIIVSFCWSNANTSNTFNTSSYWGKTAPNTSFQQLTAAYKYSLAGGTDDVGSDANLQTSWTLFQNKETTDISLVLTGAASTSLQNWIISNIVSTRADCVAFISPPQSAVVNNAGSEQSSITTWMNTLSSLSSGPTGSYAVADSGWKYLFDRYNNTYRWVPLNGDIAGLCAKTDLERDPWFSPAGTSRGVITTPQVYLLNSSIAGTTLATTTASMFSVGCSLPVGKYLYEIFFNISHAGATATALQYALATTTGTIAQHEYDVVSYASTGGLPTGGTPAMYADYKVSAMSTLVTVTGIILILSFKCFVQMNLVRFKERN